MTKVFYTNTKTSDYTEISKIARSMLEKIILEYDLKLNQFVPIKVHFGEKGNETYIPSVAYEGIIDLLLEKKIETAFIETNVLYRGSRTQRSSHIILAKEHGFTRLPIIIADGEIGENYQEILINKKYFQKCKIGQEFAKYDQILVCSHFKGHILSGFGGALKQLGMGFAARGGKLAQHSHFLPSVNHSRCTACGKCVSKCGVDAISLKPKAFIDKKLCVGCAGCIAVCPVGAINHDWEGINFCEKLAEYAFAASLNKKNIYLNFLSNITQECDCMGQKMKLIAENVGVLASLDPVALDTASLDLLQASSKEKLFENGRRCLDYAEEIGIGEKKYMITQ